MKDDGTLDNNERKELMDEYMGYVDEAMKLRDELAAATGYDKISQESTSQSASSKGFQAMSQDTGEELNGRFTALQIAGEEIKNANAEYAGGGTSHILICQRQQYNVD